jgi:hypothetical protein
LIRCGIQVFGILKELADGTRLTQPGGCPDDYYGQMDHCWAYDPKQRPSFTHLSFVMAELFAAVSPTPVHVEVCRCSMEVYLC